MKTTRFIYLLGPTCVGKGFIMKLIRRTLEVQVSCGLSRFEYISFGDIIKDLLKTDPDFRDRYSEAVRNGDLIDDVKAIDLFQKRVRSIADAGLPDLIFVDGFCRSVSQIAYAMNNQYLEEGDMVFMVEAPQQVCMDRFLHRKAMTDKQRIDAELKTFYKRYHLHTDTAPSLRAMFKEVDCSLIDIDGNDDVAEYAFPTIFSHVLPLITRGFRAEQRIPA